MVRPQWRSHWNRSHQPAVYVLQRPRAGPAHLLGGGEHGKFDAKRITWEKSQSRVGMSFTVVAYRALGYGDAVTGPPLLSCTFSSRFQFK